MLISKEVQYIPTEELLDILIASLGKKMATFLQLLKETGARCGEIANLTWASIDFQQRLVRIKAEKGSNSRVLPLSMKALDRCCPTYREVRKQYSPTLTTCDLVSIAGESA